MLRVLGTLKQSKFSGNYQSQISDLGNWVADIHNGMYPYLVRALLISLHSFVLTNNGTGGYAHCSNSTDCSRTTQTVRTQTARSTLTTRPAARCSPRPSIVSRSSRATKRLSPRQNAPARCSSLLTARPQRRSPPRQHPRHRPQQPLVRRAIRNPPLLPRRDGWLAPVVDPLNVGIEGSQSPEGEAFSLMLHAAWRDWFASSTPRAVNFATPSPTTLAWSSGRCAGASGMLMLTMVGLIVAWTFGNLV